MGRLALPMALLVVEEQLNCECACIHHTLCVCMKQGLAVQKQPFQLYGAQLHHVAHAVPSQNSVLHCLMCLVINARSSCTHAVRIQSML